MPLECIMLAVDNSCYTRNGDYTPSRFTAECEAVGYLANAKLQENQETSVGLMAIAGNRVQVLVSPGREPGQLLNSLGGVSIGGSIDVCGGLKTAQLALKNRQNKNQKQRVILFVGSPLGEKCDVNELIKIGKLFKKNNVAIDVINFGSENMTNDNTEKLEQLIAAVNTSDNSHIISIPPGPHIFADLVLTSAIMSGGGVGVSGPILSGPSSSSVAASHPGGVDPSMDPEMAMAIRMSMEEERQRQQKASGGAATTGAATANPASAAAAPMEEDEETLLAQAIAMSMQENAGGDVVMQDAASAPAAAPAPTTPATTTTAAAGSTTAASSTAASTTAAPSASDIELALEDPDFINSLLSGVPGAATSDSLLDDLTGQPKTDEKKKDGDKK